MPRNSSPDSHADRFNANDHQPCYIFTPAASSATTPAAPPSAKRRRTSKGRPSTPDVLPTESAKPRTTFPALLHKNEPESSIILRQSTFEALWSAQEARTQSILDTFNKQTLDDVSRFVVNAVPEKHDGKIPTALVLAGPNIASHAPLFQQFAARLSGEDQVGPVVVLTSKDAANLKAALKKVIKDATQSDDGDEDGDDDDEEIIVGKKGAKLLNYDLQILHNWCTLHREQKVVVAIQDTEAFDAGVMSDLIALFSAYLDRIPFVLLLGIATSLEIFHEKLPKATIRLMQGEKFDVQRAEECLAVIFNDAVAGPNSVLRLSAPVCDFLLERQRDHTQSIQTFVASLKYAYMAHFYANPLSVIMSFMEEPERLREILGQDHLQAIRHLSSFRRLVETKLAEKDIKTVRGLLDDDPVLLSAITEAVADCQIYGRNLCTALEVFEAARSCTSSTTKTTRLDLFPRAVSGSLHSQTPLVRELLLSIKKMNSASLLKLLDTVLTIPIASDLHADLATLRTKIHLLVGETTTSLTSEFDIATSSLRGTAVSKKIQLSEQKAGLTKKDSAYSKLVQEVHGQFEDYFADTLRGTEDLFLHEVFFFDDLALHKDVFAPAPRDTVEQALSKASDFLGCECCEPDIAEDSVEESVLKGSNPPTSILYQLYLESGALINGFDLWSAFYSVIAGVDADEDDLHAKVDKATAQALFYRSVAELKFLGFVKGTRKRVDHLQKLAWRGL